MCTLFYTLVLPSVQVHVTVPSRDDSTKQPATRSHNTVVTTRLARSGQPGWFRRKFLQIFQIFGTRRKKEAIRRVHGRLSKIAEEFLDWLRGGDQSKVEAYLADGGGVECRACREGSDTADVRRGDTGLIVAARHDKVEVAKILLSFGANVDAKDIYGWTALMIASGNGHVDTARLLLDRNTDIDAVSKRGETASMIANRNNHYSVVRLIQCQIIWNRRKTLIMALVESNYLPRSQSTSAAQLVPQQDLTVKSISKIPLCVERVLCDRHRLQQIVSYI